MRFDIPGTESPKYGFQKSENTRAAVAIYQHNDDPIVFNSKKSNEPFALVGNRASDPEPSVISVTTNKSINEASGKFEVVAKPSKSSSKKLFETLTDDDWLDIVFYINKEPYHIFRGIIDEINRSKAVVNGATTTVYRIVGRCFGKVWEQTQAWFSPFANDFVTEAVSVEVFKGISALLTYPDTAVLGILKSFLEKIETNAGVNWLPPKSMPGIQGTSFLDNINFGEIAGSTIKHFQNLPKRKAFNPNTLLPNGALWDIAKTFSDPIFTEMYTDFLPDGNPFSKTLNSPIELGNADMSVILRDRPLPVVPTSVPVGYKDTWGDLPVFTIQQQEIVNSNVSKAGYERYNAFYVAARIHQEEMNNNAMEMITPLLDEDSIKRHGLRRFDIQVETTVAEDNPVTAGGYNTAELCKYQRQIIRDWYCMNPYLLSGTIELGHGRPDIRIGTRLHIPGLKLNNKDTVLEENYYIESVSHAWVFGRGVRTTLGVTRGWQGDDPSYYENLQKISSRFVVPILKEIG